MSLPRTEWVRYSKTRAARLLKANDQNRQLRPTVVERYAADMASGDWMLNGETIKIAEDGSLLDGQHRLAAVVKAAEDGMTGSVAILTVSGLDPAVQNVTDTGLKRSPADVLHLAGIKNSGALSSMIRCVVRLETGRIFEGRGSQQMVTNSEMLRWLEAHPESMSFMDRNAWSLRKTNVPPTSAAAALWYLDRVDTFKAAEFLDGLVTLAELPKGSPIATLSRTVNTLRINRSRLEPVEWVGMIFATWNAWAGDQRLTSITPRRWPADRFPWPLSPAEALRQAEERAEGKERRYLEAV